ncbi:ComF family protein [Evansella clarkii]|uniref:ComF family protein n=1 Tax=Evansella clarkii TaxID=79879 RepID=UPI000B452685|nr:ComF family protein [Evansella clarkii]
MSRWTNEFLGNQNLCLFCLERFDTPAGWRWALGIEERTSVCGKCSSKMDRITEVVCHICGRPPSSGVTRSDAGKSNGKLLRCYDCERWAKEEPWDTKPFIHQSLYSYNSFMQEVLAQFKYRGDSELARIFSEDVVKLARTLGKFDIVTTIPLDEKRQWERAFNQGELLAEPFFPVKLLQRSGAASGEKQSKRSREERLAALKGVFTLSENGAKVNLIGKSILIVDDIYTTGATLRSAGAELYKAGAACIFAVTVARATGEREDERVSDKGTEKTIE